MSGLDGAVTRSSRRASGRVASALVLAGLLGAAVGCAAPSLTSPAPGRPSAPAAAGRNSALSGAVDKLNLISQDGCQTDPPETIYPGCDRYLAEVRSAVGTVAGYSAGRPGSAAIQATSSAIMAGAAAFDRDGCGGGPYRSSGQNTPLCVADLGRVRAGLSTLLAQTHGIAGG